MQSPPRESHVWKTPLYEQYWRLKDSVPGCVLFFRLGDFFELFGQDAIDSAPLLEVQLTSRDKSSDSPVPMCGVPAHALDQYAEKLLQTGRHIAITEQSTAPIEGKTKLVQRSVVRILTPGLPVDFGRLDARSQAWFLSVGGASQKSTAPLKVLAFDFLGGELFEGDVAGPNEMLDLLARLDPREILLPSAWLSSAKFTDEWGAFAERSPWHARVTPWAGVGARENLEAYLVYTQRCDRGALKRLLPDAADLDKLAGSGRDEWAKLPANVFEHWAIFPELFQLLDRCGSAVGSRRLRALLSNPLRSEARLLTRQRAFAALGDPARVLERSKEVYDLERLLGRFRVGAAAPRELLRFVHSLRAVEATLALPVCAEPAWKAFTRDEGLPELGALRAGLRPLMERLESALNVDVDANRTTELSQLIKAGFDAEFDRLHDLQNTGEDWLVRFESDLRASTNIASLKVRYNRVFGHYIEVTKTHLEKVPAHFERKQTTVGGERFTTAELRAKESEILTAGARSEAKAREILENLQREILSRDQDLRDLVKHLSWIDAVAGAQSSIARLRRFGPWVEPQLESGDFRFSIKEARHPIIENLSGSFVSNSLELGGPGGKRCLVLTGPNMAGKSTIMRQTGLCLLLAQCGLPVPAAAMTLAPCSGFYSRMGATDRILAGESTFMVEMKETAAILRSADRQSFILLDEIGRGTSTQDGLAIAHAVLEYLHNEVDALCLFATHYHELSDFALELPRAVNGSMGIREWEGELVFLRTLELKPAESSHGIFVARMAGLPKKLLSRAQKYFLEFHAGAGGVSSPQMSLDLSGPLKGAAWAEQPQPALGEIRDELSRLDINELSPKQAWLALEGLVERARNYSVKSNASD